MGAPEPTDDQRAALAELRALSSTDAIGFIKELHEAAGLHILVRVNTAVLEPAAGGLPVQAREELVVTVPHAYPWVPPKAWVLHDRWIGFPHVLQGERLCLYLNPDAEWDPTGGMAPFLDRLWTWFADAVANRFDAVTALYHPVGGVLHRTAGAPSLVVGDVLGELAGFEVDEIRLQTGGPARVDVLGRRRPDVPADQQGFRGLLVVLSGPLPRGGGRCLSDLAIAVRGQDSRRQRKQLLAAVAKTGRVLGRDQHLHLLIAVPYGLGTKRESFHLVGWRLRASDITAAVRAAGHRHKPDDPYVDDEPEVEWTYVDDVRVASTTRRDHERPVSWFAGRTIEVWGCGALGSWVAEHLVRSGVARLILRDPGYVTSGLLVRQNYAHADVGRPKAEALAERMRTITPGSTVVEEHVGSALAGIPPDTNVNAIFDCTVSNAVAVAVDQLQTSGRLSTPVVQVATDVGSACLGHLTIVGGTDCGQNATVDGALRERVLGDKSLDAYAGFWNRDAQPTLVPTTGCSTPTFHGSSADAMAIAATAVTLAAGALAKRINCGYLWASPHAGLDAPFVAVVGADT